MLNAIIRFSLRHRLLIIALALLALFFGIVRIASLPVDVLPDLDRPRVTVITEAHGMAPEEVESLITFPLETALNGATGVQAVRSSSGVGISIVWVEFDWGTDMHDDRQIVNERLALASERLPEDVTPQLAPISSVMGQIMTVGMWSEDGTTEPMELRTLADWVVRQRLLTISGVSQVFVMGGERKQFQVLVDPDRLLAQGVTLNEVIEAVEKSNVNVTGGYLDSQGPSELMVRSIGRIEKVEDVALLPVKMRAGRPILLDQVADVIEGPQVKRGDASAWVNDGSGEFHGGSAVLLTVNKQPNSDTRRITAEVEQALKDLAGSLPADVRVDPSLYQQRDFIDLAIDNVAKALRDGSLLVVLVLFVFLLNFRTTFITLTAIPLSVVVTAVVFHRFGLSINTMTLGGLAVAVGELVDDAIVDVENVHRRLRENRAKQSPDPALLVVYRASTEVRNSIVYGTAIVVLVFLPLFGLSGMEGQLFRPLALAYIVSILSSLAVSLTVTPVLAYWLLGGQRHVSLWQRLWRRLLRRPSVDERSESEREGPVLAMLKWAARGVIRLSVNAPGPVLLGTVAAVAIAVMAAAGLERDFLPPFDEGVAQLNIVLPPGTSLAKSREVAGDAEEQLKKIHGLRSFLTKTGRAELDEHAVGVNMSEVIGTFSPDSGRSREETLKEIRESMAKVRGPVTTVEQPMAHLISHMLSGVQAQVAVKIYGDDLEILRREAKEIEAAVSHVDGVKDLFVERQVNVEQLRIELDRNQLAFHGMLPQEVNDFIETAMQGKVVGDVRIGQRSFDLLVRMKESAREDVDRLERLRLPMSDGREISLGQVATIGIDYGPNTINREQARRRIVVQCNVAGRGLVDVVDDIRVAIKPVKESMPVGYFLELGGQFESQQRAGNTIAVLSAVSLVGVFLVLFTMFRSANFALQVMVALPTALIGAVAALLITGQTLSIASVVGFISLCGIASRNGILLLNHYLHLVRHEGETWSKEMLIRAGSERLAPVLMTALTSGIGLIPLAMAAGEPGKEILYPIATVIIGGLISSTLLEFLVRPALFWTVGREAGRRLVEGNHVEDVLEEKR